MPSFWSRAACLASALGLGWCCSPAVVGDVDSGAQGADEPDWKSPLEPLCLETVELGEVPMGRLRVESFTFMNCSSERLEIGHVDADCGCEDVLVAPMCVEPGGVMQIDLSFLAVHPGDASARVDVFERETANLLCAVDLTAIVTPLPGKDQITLLPRHVDLGEFEPSARTEFSIELRLRDAAPLSTWYSDSGLEWLSVTGFELLHVRRLAPEMELDEVAGRAREFSLIVACRAPAWGGRARGELRIQPAAPYDHLGDFLVLEADVPAPVRFEVPSIYLGRVQAGSCLREQLSFALDACADLEDLRLETSSEQLELIHVAPSEQTPDVFVAELKIDIRRDARLVREHLTAYDRIGGAAPVRVRLEGWVWP